LMVFTVGKGCFRVLASLFIYACLLKIGFGWL